MPAYVNHYWGYDPIIHWACRRCIVRACCNENCNLTKIQFKLCSECKKYPCEDQCEPLKIHIMWDHMGHVYGDLIKDASLKFIKETSVVYRMAKNKSLGELSKHEN